MNQPSFISLISYRVFPAQMGGQKCVVGFYDYLSKKAKIVLAVSKDNQEEKKSYAVEPFLFNHWKGQFNIFYIFRLLKMIQLHQVDYIIIEHSYFGWLGLILRFFSKKKLIIRMHNIEGHRFRDMQRFWWQIYLVYEKWICNRADLLWFVSKIDCQFAIEHWGIDAKKCTPICYGISEKEIPSIENRALCRSALIKTHNLDPKTKLFLFNGSLNYIPNIDALRIIIRELIPRLAKTNLTYKIFICGNGISADWEKELKAFPEVIFEGYQPDISLYFKGCDCFINPVTLGGGLKTKLVEALANNMDIISVEASTKAIDTMYTNKKIMEVADYHWDIFAKAMCCWPNASNNNTPPAFFQAFNWEQITRKAILSLEK